MRAIRLKAVLYSRDCWCVLTIHCLNVLFLSQIWFSDAVILICEYGYTPFKVKPIKYPCNSFGIFNNKKWNNEWITVVEVVVIIIVSIVIIIVVIIINFYLNYYSIEYIQNIFILINNNNNNNKLQLIIILLLYRIYTEYN